MNLFKRLYQYRELLKSNVKKEIRGKYKGSFLGLLWSFINPLLSVLIYAIVFPLILKNPQPNYVVFLIVAIIPWNFFVTVINQGVNTVVINGNIIKKVDIKKFCVSGYVYVTIWCIFVCGWIWIKAGHVIGEEEKHALPNFVGIYYDENCNYRKLIDMTSNFNKGSVEIAIWARDNIEDLSADNIILMTDGYYNRIWATAMLEITSDKLPYQKDANYVYTVQDGLKDSERKYLVKCVWDEQQRQNAYKEEIKEIREMDNIEILYENENGYVAKINR